MKRNKNVVLILILLLSSNFYAQINIKKIGKDVAKKAVNNGDLIITQEPNTSDNKKSVKEVEVLDLEKPIYGSIYLSRKINSHNSFSSLGEEVEFWLNIKSDNGKKISLALRIDENEANNKFASFEIAPDQLSPDNYQHRDLAVFFNSLEKGVNTLSFYVGNDEKEIAGESKIDLSNGTGNFGKLTKQIAEEKAREAEEERKKKEEKERKKKIAIEEFQNSPDAVKVIFKNTCEYEGNLWVSTGNELTDFSVKLGGYQSSNPTICRPGNKVYMNNKVFYTIGAPSNNRTVEVCITKPATAPGCMGSSRIAVLYLKNYTGKEVNYSIMGDGASLTGSMQKDDSGFHDYNIKCCPYGYYLKINDKDYVKITQEHDGKVIEVR